MGEREGLGWSGLEGLSHAWILTLGGSCGWTDRLPPPPATTMKFGDLRLELPLLPFHLASSQRQDSLWWSLCGLCFQKYRNLISMYPRVSTNLCWKKPGFATMKLISAGDFWPQPRIMAWSPLFFLYSLSSEHSQDTQFLHSLFSENWSWPKKHKHITTHIYPGFWTLQFGVTNTSCCLNL